MDPKLGPTHAIVLYDPATGHIVHTLVRMTFEGDPVPDWTAMEAQARSQAAKHHPGRASLATLRSENHNPTAAYTVDTERRALVAIRPAARKSKV